MNEFESNADASDLIGKAYYFYVNIDEMFLKSDLIN